MKKITFLTALSALLFFPLLSFAIGLDPTTIYTGSCSEEPVYTCDVEAIDFVSVYDSTGVLVAAAVQLDCYGELNFAATFCAPVLTGDFVLVEYSYYWQIPECEITSPCSDGTLADCRLYNDPQCGEYKGEIAFEVVAGTEPAAPAGGTPIFTISAGSDSSILAYVGQLFTDLSGYIIVLIGLPLAFWTVAQVLKLRRENDKKAGALRDRIERARKQ